MAEGYDFKSGYRAIVDKVSVMSIATVDDAGAPHAANVYFYADRLGDLIFISDPKSTHSQHLNARPEVAITIYPEAKRPDEIVGLQLKGRCTAERDESFEWLWESYVLKFPFAKPMHDRAMSQSFYRVHPYWARLIDNRVSFSFKMEIDWTDY